MELELQKTEKGFIQKIERKWRKFLLPSKVLFVVACMETWLVIIVAILKLTLDPTQTCIDLTVPVNCSSEFLLSQSLTSWEWAIFFSISIWHGLFYGNIYELYAAMFLACYMTAWSVWRFVEPYKKEVVTDDIFLVGTCIAQLFYFVVSPKLYKEYAWVLYRKAGADQAVRGLYRKYLQWSCIQKLDAFFGFFSVFLSGNGIVNSALDWSMFALLIVFLGVGYYAVNKELVGLTIAWFCLFPFLPAYIIYNFLVITILQDPNQPDDVTARRLKILFSVCGSGSLISRVALCVISVIVFRNYGKGLVSLVQLKKEEKKKVQEGHDDDEDVSVSVDGGEYGYINYGGETLPQQPENENNMDWKLKDVIDNTTAIEKGDTPQVRKY